MIRSRRALLGALLVVCAATAVAQVHEGKTIVTARLVADTTRVQPVRPFTAGIELRVEPGWHVYWENPGDTALPIEVAWRLPAGATASPLQWPAPSRFRETGGVTVFGYEREALLLATIAPPDVIPPAGLPLQANVSWLVCEKLCLPGEARVTLRLPPGEPERSSDAAAIRRAAASVPMPGDGAGVRIARATASNEGERWLIRAEVEATGKRVVDFFPRTIEGFTLEHGSIAVRGARIELVALADEPEVTPRSLEGVLQTDGGAFDVVAAVSVVDGSLSEDVPPATGVVAPPDPPRPETPGDESPVEPPPAPRAASGDWLARDFAVPADGRGMSLVTLLLFAALGGLLLNVMPCVLPVISLKVLSFVQQAGHERRRTRILGLAFGAGVIASFWVLVAAVAVIRSTAEQIGWGFQFQSPGFVLAMSAVVVVFAMNLFGVFEIAGFGFSGTGGHGTGGAFVHGTLATILATPCTAPFLGTAIGFAFTQSLWVLFLAFTAAGAGLALPYVLLSWNPGWLRWLPRPGAWMIRFKQAMGFVLLATVVWLLSVLGSQLGPEGVTWSLVFLTFVAFAVWVVAQVPRSAPRRARVLSAGAAIALVLGGYLWAIEHELRWREPAGADAARTAEGGIRWEPFSLTDLQRRVERGETVFVDFTADWCWNCKVNERTVLATSVVEERIRDLDVTAVKADWTRRDPEITRLLAKFGRAGVPFYAVFPAGRLTEPIALAEVITPGSVVEALERAGPSRLENQR